jgi:hypothetical protein
VIIPSCSPSSAPEKTGEISISISLEASARSVNDLNLSDFSFNINGKGPDSKTFSISTLRGENTASTGKLTAGTWTITVEALHYVSSGSISFGDGNTDVDVVPGAVSPCAVSISPFNGEGSLHITVNWNSSLVQNPVIESSLSRIGYATKTVAFTISSGQGNAQIVLDSGIYSFSLVLKDGVAEIAGAADSIRIINSATTSATYNLTIQQCTITDAYWEVGK